MRYFWIFFYSTASLFFCPQSLFADSKKMKKIVEVQKNIYDKSSKSQIKINKLNEETKKLLQNYRLTLKKIYNTKIYNTQLREFIKNQKQEMISLRKQIEEVKDTGKNVFPLMIKMLKNLELFIDLDIPFHITERKERVLELKSIMKRADVSVSEKYRRILSAYKIEREYGKTISTYRGMEKVGDKDIIVNYIRIGRISFLYQSLDRKKNSLWNNDKKEWMTLPRKYKKSLNTIISVAKKQIAPTILKVPVPSIQSRQEN